MIWGVHRLGRRILVVRLVFPPFCRKARKERSGQFLVCASLCCKELLLCIPFLHRSWGSCGQQIQAYEENASSGSRSDPRRQSWAQQDLGPENQDSQHKLNQPRAAFPNVCKQAVCASLKARRDFSALFSRVFVVLRRFARASRKLPRDHKALFTKNQK